MSALDGGAGPLRLRATGLVRRFRRQLAVDRVDLMLARGEVVGLLGPNGAGKTTIFKMLSGSLRPSEGRVLLGDQDITALPMHRRARMGISYLPQEASVFRRLSVAGNVMAVLEGVERDRLRRRERLDALLAELGLSDKADRRADALSGGERRRLEITRALVLEPAFMLLDEPFAGVDPLAVIETQKIIADLRARDIGVMITDHNVRETLAICDRAYIIKDGRVLDQGTPEEVTANQAVRDVYLGEHFRLE